MTAPPSLVHMIEGWARLRPARPALHAKRDGAWKTITWKEYWASVRAVGKALVSLGHQPGDCVAIVGANHPEWVQFEFGIEAARGIPAPIYPTNTKEQAAYIVANSGAKILVVDGKEQLDKFLEAEAEGLFPRLEHILTFFPIPRATDPRIRTFEEVVGLGEQQPDSELDARLAAITPDETCLLIYTSGTTGVPKGVMLDHGGQIMVGEAAMEHFDVFQNEPYIVVSYLPLCHQAEQMLTNVFALKTGGEVYFCPDLAFIKDYLVEARPTVFLGVPRVWEKFEAALRARLAETTGLRAALAGWARKTELAAMRKQIAMGDPDYSTLRRRLARLLVADKIRKGLGLDRLEVAVTGSAPIAVSTQEFFASIGILVYEGYGLSETSGLATITDYRRPGFGTVGVPLRGVEVRISSEGEIQLKGRNNTRGYLHMPEATAELYTEDGWLHTGDLGHVDGEGNLHITGRLKELLITAGGKNVAPVEMENHIKSIKGVGQVMVVGDRQPYLAALITLDPEGLDELCVKLDLRNEGIEAVSRHPAVRAYLDKRIDETCNAKVARYQTIKKFEVVPTEFSVDGGELTATMKLRRKQVTEKYADVIARLYEEVSEARAAS